jgi:hypothetical protein
MSEILLYALYPDVPSKMTVGSKSYYLTNNLFYGGVHWAVRKKLVEWSKLYLLSELKPNLKQVNPSNYPLSIEIVYHSAKHTFDLDNKAGYWLKVLLDLIKGNGIVPDDNVKFIGKITSSYKRLAPKSDDILEVYIYNYTQSDIK